MRNLASAFCLSTGMHVESFSRKLLVSDDALDGRYLSSVLYMAATAAVISPSMGQRRRMALPQVICPSLSASIL